MGVRKKRKEKSVRYPESGRDELLVYVGQQVLAARQRLGLSQEQLAEKAGCAPATVFLVENARRNATIRSLSVLATALGVEVAELSPDRRLQSQVRAPARSPKPFPRKWDVPRTPCLESNISSIRSLRSPRTSPSWSRRPQGSDREIQPCRSLTSRSRHPRARWRACSVQGELCQQTWTRGELWQRPDDPGGEL